MPHRPGLPWEIESLTHHHHSLVRRVRPMTWRGHDGLGPVVHVPQHPARGMRPRPRTGTHSDRRGSGHRRRPAVIAGAPAAVHCAAGKDRTGTVVALALTSQGPA